MLMTTNLNLVRKTLIFLTFLLSLTVCDASAQFGGKKKDLPDASSFYMSRRQYQIVDDSPIVRMGNGQPAPGSAGAGGPVNANGAPLTRAGFTSYTSDVPTISKPLPKVHNGVPVQPPATPPPTSSGKKSLKAKAGSLGKDKSNTAAPKPSAPTSARSYDSYKGYNPSEGGDYGYSSASSSRSATNVRGSVLHWSRKRRTGQ